MTCVPGSLNRAVLSSRVAFSGLLLAFSIALLPCALTAQDAGPRPSTVLAAADHDSAT